MHTSLIGRLGPGSFRFVLAVLVYVSHISGFRVGHLAVYAFFVLSGYWIAQMFARKYSKTRAPLRVYLTSRLIRIFPLYIICNLVALTLFALFNTDAAGFITDPVYLARNLVLFGIANAGNEILGVSWSLDIEVQFYLVAPLVFFIVHRAGVTAGIFLFTALALFSCWYFLSDAFRDFKYIGGYLIFFFSGAAIYRFQYAPGPKAAILSVAAYLLFISSLYFADQTSHLIIGDRFLDQAQFEIVSMVQAILLVPFIAFNVRQKSSSLDGHLGNMSYPFYLLHYPVLVSFGTMFGIGSEEFVPRLAAKIGVLALAVLVTLVVYVWADRPIEKKRRAYMRHNMERAAPLAATGSGVGE